MTFAQPWQLAWLLLVPVLYWLSLPPRPRQHAFTAHFAEWQQALAALRRRPRQWSGLRFVLLAGAAVAVAAAAAAPLVPGRQGPHRLVVLLDASASMATRTASGESAFERAKERLAAAFAELPADVDLTLLPVGRALLRRHGASARDLQDLGEPAGGLDVDLGAVAAAIAGGDTVVWTLTDGQGQRTLPTAGALTRLDASGANAAVLAVHAEDHWPLPDLPVTVDVVAYAGGPIDAELQVGGAVAAVPPSRLRLTPGEAKACALSLTRLPAGGEVTFTVRLVGDVLADDDRQVLSLPPLPAPRLAALTEGDAGPFARVAAEALATEVGGTVVAPDAGGEVGLLLVDGGRASLQPGQQRAVTFGCVLQGVGAAAEPWPEPRLADWDRTSPCTAGLDLSELRVDAAWRGILPPGEAFLWADDAGQRVPLAVVAGDGNRASVHFAFRLQDSNLPLLAAFPQLLRRAFVRCYGAGAALRATTMPPTANELDLRAPAMAPDRALPPFATPDRDLAAWWVLAGLVLLALRAFVR